MRAPRDGRPVRHGLERIVIAAEDMDRIHATSHANECSLHALLLASFALAIRDVSEGNPRQILMRSSVAQAAAQVPKIRWKLLKLVESAPDGFVVTNSEGRILTANAAFLEIAQSGVSCILLDHLPVEQVNGPLGMPRVARVMSDHADCRTLAVQLPQQVHDGFAVLRVQVSRRLVCQQDRR